MLIRQTISLLAITPIPDALYTYLGADGPTDGISEGRPTDNTFHNNVVSNAANAMQLKSTDDMAITGEDHAVVDLDVYQVFGLRLVVVFWALMTTLRSLPSPGLSSSPKFVRVGDASKQHEYVRRFSHIRAIYVKHPSLA